MGKKKNETKEQAKSVVTPSVPEWITGPMKDYLSRVQQFGQMDAGQLVPGASGLQRMAFDRIGQYGAQGFRPQVQQVPQGQASPLAMLAPEDEALKPKLSDKYGIGSGLNPYV